MGVNVVLLLTFFWKCGNKKTYFFILYFFEKTYFVKKNWTAIFFERDDFKRWKKWLSKKLNLALIPKTKLFMVLLYSTKNLRIKIVFVFEDITNGLMKNTLKCNWCKNGFFHFDDNLSSIDVNHKIFAVWVDLLIILVTFFYLKIQRIWFFYLTS